MNKEKLKQILHEIGYWRLILLGICGIFLIVVSIPEEEKGILKKEETIITLSSEKKENDIYVEKMEQRLESTLNKIKGVGKAEVMITLKTSSETIINKDMLYETSTEVSEGEEKKNQVSSVKQEETVMTEEDGNQKPYVIKEVEPVIEGVIVVMEGGDNSLVVNSVTEAVQALFSIEAHKIKVLKMEDGA